MLGVALFLGLKQCGLAASGAGLADDNINIVQVYNQIEGELDRPSDDVRNHNNIKHELDQQVPTVRHSRIAPAPAPLAAAALAAAPSVLAEQMQLVIDGFVVPKRARKDTGATESEATSGLAGVREKEGEDDTAGDVESAMELVDGEDDLLILPPTALDRYQIGNWAGLPENLDGSQARSITSLEPSAETAVGTTATDGYTPSSDQFAQALSTRGIGGVQSISNVSNLLWEEHVVYVKARDVAASSARELQSIEVEIQTLDHAMAIEQDRLHQLEVSERQQEKEYDRDMKQAQQSAVRDAKNAQAVAEWKSSMANAAYQTASSAVASKKLEFDDVEKSVATQVGTEAKAVDESMRRRRRMRKLGSKAYTDVTGK